MHNQIDRDKIKHELERHYKNALEDRESVISDMNKLGSTTAIAGQEAQRAEEYRQLEFKGAMVQQSITLFKQLIIHAEYCDYKIIENDNCHKATNSRISGVESSVKPLLEVKRDFLGIANLTTMVKKSPLKMIEWGAIIWIAKHLYLIDGIPKS